MSNQRVPRGLLDVTKSQAVPSHYFHYVIIMVEETEIQQFERLCAELGIQTTTINFRAPTIDKFFDLYRSLKKEAEKELGVNSALKKEYERLLLALDENDISWDGSDLSLPKNNYPVLGQDKTISGDVLDRLENAIKELKALSSKKRGVVELRPTPVEMSKFTKSHSKMVVDKRGSIYNSLKKDVKRLFARRKQALLMREIADLAGVSKTSVYKYIGLLEKDGVVKRAHKGARGAVKAYVKG